MFAYFHPPLYLCYNKLYKFGIVERGLNMTGYDNKDFSIGLILKQLRVKKGITQNTLSEKTGYSIRQIRRFENDETTLHDEAISVLSRFYNVDLNAYISIESSFNSLDNYSNFVNLRRIIENNEFNKLKVEYDKLHNLADFKCGEPFLLIQYTLALIHSFEYKNYSESSSICINALKAFNYSDYTSSLNNSILVELAYPILFLISYNHVQCDEIDHAYNLSIKLYDHFHSFVFSSPIPLKSDMYHLKKYYIVTANNLADLYFLSNNYEKSLKYLDLALDLAKEFRINLYMHYHMQLKFEIYYKIEDYKNAQRYYTIFENFCELNDKMAYYASVRNEINVQYPLLFS